MSLTKEERDQLLEVTNYIHELGIPAHLKGYSLLREAIIMTIEDHEVVTSITKLLYPTVAKRFKTTDKKVERAIRHAIEVSWIRGSVELQKMIFGYNSCEAERPTNSEFIADIADYIKLNQ